MRYRTRRDIFPVHLAPGVEPAWFAPVVQQLF